MKALISYRYSGEVVKNLEVLLSSVCESLRRLRIEPYCVYFERSKYANRINDPSKMMELAFSQINYVDFLFVIQSSELRSEGMLMEIGYAIAKGRKIIIATRSDVRDTYLPSMADFTIEYNNVADLSIKIESFNFQILKDKGGDDLHVSAENSAAFSC